MDFFLLYHIRVKFEIPEILEEITFLEEDFP
ncbi:hypothetical protein KL86CLO1_10279 [uncultured Eubacteriales bacterium]|uniref:Uncharacterized protein n=1 Tax=uncultured Eubacteriales bacterium TaxID=172733 RepID=A0A212IZR0_9FIRM|nr:hypothetical protein KL86CLO1_10279 [uncultured Eubacteriales bacterium]